MLRRTCHRGTYYGGTELLSFAVPRTRAVGVLFNLPRNIPLLELIRDELGRARIVTYVRQLSGHYRTC